MNFQDTLGGLIGKATGKDEENTEKGGLLGMAENALGNISPEQREGILNTVTGKLGVNAETAQGIFGNLGFGGATAENAEDGSDSGNQVEARDESDESAE